MGEELKTPRDIEYYLPGPARSVIIPAGTPVIPATNLPEGSVIAFWVEPWDGMDQETESHQRTYGFGLRQEDMQTGEEEAANDEALAAHETEEHA